MIGGRSALLSAAGGGNPYGNWTGNYEDVSLLMRDGVESQLLIPIDESSSPKGITVVGSPSINTTLFKYGDSALDFPGASGNHYSIFGFNNFTPGLGAWTVEAWLYRKSTVDWVTMSGSNFYINGNSTRTVVGDGSVNRILVSSVPALNTWVHVAVVRESNGTIRLFFDGIQQASSTGSLSTVTTTGILIGGRTAGATVGTDALLDDVRVTVGVARYTSNFTPPAAELPANVTDDPSYSSVSLLLRNGGRPLAPTDESPTPKTINTSGNAGISTTTFKYGNSSFSLPGGASDYFTSPPNAGFDMSTVAFTIEFWLYLNSINTDRGLLSIATSSGDCIFLSITSSNLIQQTYGGGLFFTNPIALTSGQWYHIAFTRLDNDHRIFVNGVGQLSTISKNYSPGATLFIGAAWRDSLLTPLNGFIDDLRITKGFARYTENFLPPPAELPAI